MVFFRLILSVFETTAMLKFIYIYSIFLWLLLPDFRVTDEALVAETAVWPNFFLMNVFFALKGSKLLLLVVRASAV